MRLNDKRTFNYFKTTTKTHITMDQRNAFPPYGEHLHFLLTRCGWKLTKIKGHRTFEQKKFKNGFCNHELSSEVKR